MKTYTKRFQQLVSASWQPLKIVCTILLLTSISFNLSAQIPSTFCDGNPADWANFRTTYPINGYKLDPANATNNTDDQFTTGSKDGDQISAWRYSLGSANAKGDITNAGVALTGTNNCILRFFGDRTSDNGDASIGFWFYVNPVSLNPDGTFSGVHTNGDLLILSDFTNGGTTPTIKVYTWQNGSLVLKSGSSTSFCAAVNQTTSPVPAGLTYTASNGSNQYAPNTFYEGAINLCSLGISTCFSTFLFETRNSQSLTASLQDFSIGSFNATPAAPTATVTQPTCTVATGTVSVTAPNAGYTYKLTGTSPVRSPITSTTGVFTNVAPGTYSLVALQGSCVSTPVTITVNAQPPTPASPTLSAVQPTCTVSTGSITVTAPTGSGLTYSLDGGPFQTGVTFSNVAAGSHCVRVKNSFGCISSQTCITINAQPQTPARPVVTITEATLCGTATAPSLTVNCPVTGVTYTLTQTGVAGSRTITYSGTGTVVFGNLLAGKGFSITATNASGCVSAATNCTNYTTNSCAAPRASITTVTPEVKQPVTKVKAYPNPYNDKVRFVIQSTVSGKGSLEVYNMLGQKIKTLYTGSIEAGVDMPLEYNVSKADRANLIYILRVGKEKVTGKLLQAN